MDSHSQVEDAITKSNHVLHWALWLTLSSLLCGLLHPLFFILLFVSGIGTAVFALVWRLFGAVQLRLGELLVLVAFFGNLLGWGIKSFRVNSVDEIITFSIIAAFATVWLLGGVTSGLLIARRLKVEDSITRGALMLVFVLYPAALAGLPLCILTLIIMLGTGQKSEFILALNWGFFCAIFWLIGRTVRAHARLAMSKALDVADS
jgi:hypothetical protein